MDQLLELVLTESRRLSQEGARAGYEAFVELTELRDHLLTMVEDSKPSLTTDQKVAIRELLQMDPIIMEHMLELKNEAKLGLLRIQHSQKQKDAYQAPSVTDSIMFDQRK